MTLFLFSFVLSYLLRRHTWFMYTLYSVQLILCHFFLWNFTKPNSSMTIYMWIYPAIVWFWVLIKRSNKLHCYLVMYVLTIQHVYCRHIQHIINSNYRRWPLWCIFTGFSQVVEHHINCLHWAKFNHLGDILRVW